MMKLAMQLTLAAQSGVLRLIEENNPAADIASRALLLFVKICFALERSPGMLYDLTLVTRAAYLQKSGDLEQVIEIARQRIARCYKAEIPEQVLLKMYLAENLIDAGSFDEVETLVEESLAVLEKNDLSNTPNFIEVLRVKALYKETLFQWDDAYDLMHQLLKCKLLDQNSGSTDLLKLRLANLCIKQRKLEEAESILSTLLKRSSSLGAALCTSAGLYHACANELQKSAKFLDEAASLLKTSTPKQGRRVDYPGYWFARAVLAYEQNSFEQCESLLQALIASIPRPEETDHPTLLVLLPYLQDIFEKRGRHDEAAQVKLRISQIKRAYSITRNLTL
jgi:tetratricopeptide (TPR) repeat protein